MKKVLLVDEDTSERGRLSVALRASGFTTLETADAWSALEMMPAWSPDLVVLEWKTPEGDGLAVLDDLKRDPATRSLPVIMVSERDSEEDRVMGLQRGADDYVTKPFSCPELVARVNALLRRASNTPDIIAASGLKLDVRTHTLTADGTVTPLRPAEFRLLHYLMAHPESVHTRTQLLHRVWQHRPEMEERSVDVHVRRLRKALESTQYDGLIQTVRGIGYRFSARFTA